ncbi:DNA mismatch repair endonuclease MutL [Glaciecola siphonariae]|uniref:DNA mismatch repair protein MutL n=1 Tax=Glaciecola siphonariae TaxID=521012 RepID=A0ABV9M198_9ALTE
MAQLDNVSPAIHLLPPQLANQIAAGEVVERPASVVKELLENSIDAKADSIHIEIDQGGHKRILIRDTGSGISKDQLELALSRHATSKIYNLDDLECITSMGFRGEALASISSVSRLSLTSHPEAQSEAWQAQTQGMDMAVTLSPAAHPIGTSIEVLDLFFNTPARRKFLRAQKTEFQHIEQVVRRIALGHPNIAFTLKHNGKLIFKWGAGTLEQRVAAVCSPNFLTYSTRIDYRHEQISLSGWCSCIGQGWQTNDQQYIFVNQRMIKDKLVLHALRQAYEGMLADNQYPGYVLFLNLPAQDMDINVHPAKHEVRFHQARKVHDVIFQAVSQALLLAQAKQEQAQHDVPTDSSEAASHDLVSDTSNGGANKAEHDAAHGQSTLIPSAPNHDYIQPLRASVHEAPPAPQHTAAPFGVSSVRRQSVTSAPASSAGRSGRFQGPSADVGEAGRRYQELMQPRTDSLAKHSQDTHSQRTHRYVMSGAYALFETNKQLVALPLARLISLYLQHSLSQANTPQPLLMPVSVQKDHALCESSISSLEECGFVIDNAHNKYILKQVPSGLRALPWAHLFAELSAQLQNTSAKSSFMDALGDAYYALISEDTQRLHSLIAALPDDTIGDALSHHGRELCAKSILSLCESL